MITSPTPEFKSKTSIQIIHTNEPSSPPRESSITQNRTQNSMCCRAPPHPHREASPRTPTGANHRKAPPSATATCGHICAPDPRRAGTPHGLSTQTHIHATAAPERPRGHPPRPGSRTRPNCRRESTTTHQFTPLD